MKIIKNILSVVVVAMFLLPSCTKHEIPIPGQVVSGGKMAFVHASEKSVGIFFYAAGSKVSSASALSAGVFGGANGKGTRFPQSDYCLYSAGAMDFATYIQGKVLIDSVKTSSVAGFSLETDKSYTYYYYDNADGTQTAKIIEDNLPTLDNTQASVRFVNLVNNAGNNVKLVISATNQLPAPTLPYTLFDGQTYETVSATPYVFNFTGTAVSYTLTFQVWNTGVTPNKLLVSKTSEVVTRGRTYTVVAYGSALGTGVGFLKFINKAY